MAALDLAASDSSWLKSHDLGAMSNQDQVTMIGIYCDQHPLVPYQQSVLNLFTILPETDDAKPKPDAAR